MEPVFDIIPGVTDTVVGYMGGDKTTANYSMVSSGKTQHIETIEVTFDPEKVAYRTLLDAFWRSIDPTDQYGQFADEATLSNRYFVASIDQQEEAQQSLEDLAKLRKFKDPIVIKYYLLNHFSQLKNTIKITIKKMQSTTMHIRWVRPSRLFEKV